MTTSVEITSVADDEVVVFDGHRLVRHGGLEDLVEEEGHGRLDDGEHQGEEGYRDEGELDRGGDLALRVRGRELADRRRRARREDGRLTGMRALR